MLEMGLLVRSMIIRGTTEAGDLNIEAAALQIADQR
jgi:hypothetical protein